MNLHSTRIVTKDVPGLTRFYQAVLEIHPVFPFESPNLYVEFSTGASILAIADENAAAKYNAGAAIGAANRSMILEFEVSDLTAERTRLNNVVTDWAMEPTLAPWGNFTMLFRDPDGNLINFFSPAGRK